MGDFTHNGLSCPAHSVLPLNWLSPAVRIRAMADEVEQRCNQVLWCPFPAGSSYSGEIATLGEDDLTSQIERAKGVANKMKLIGSVSQRVAGLYAYHRAFYHLIKNKRMHNVAGNYRGTVRSAQWSRAHGALGKSVSALGRVALVLNYGIEATKHDWEWDGEVIVGNSLSVAATGTIRLVSEPVLMVGEYGSAGVAQVAEWTGFEEAAALLREMSQDIDRFHLEVDDFIDTVWSPQTYRRGYVTLKTEVREWGDAVENALVEGWNALWD